MLGRMGLIAGAIMASVWELSPSYCEESPRCKCEVDLVSLPRDHAIHPCCPSEWWYASGTLASPDGSEWGYHFTVFRKALPHDSNDSRSGNDRNGMFVGHLTITNLSQKTHVFFQTLGSAFLGSAQGNDQRLEIRVGKWRLFQEDESIHIEAYHKTYGIALTLESRKPPVLHGGKGLGAKTAFGRGPCYHYSIMSMRAQGVLTWQEKVYSVRGDGWVDREFGVDLTPSSVRGWDWFALKLNNGVDAMVYSIRFNDEGMEPFAQGTVMPGEGSPVFLGTKDFRLEPLDFWTSPLTGARYPVRWFLRIPSLDLELKIQPVIRAHELDAATTTQSQY